MRWFRFITVVMLLLITTVCFAQPKCYLTKTIICYDNTDGLNKLLRVVAATAGTDPQHVKAQLVSMMLNDVSTGNAIVLQPGFSIAILETNPIFAKFTVNNIVYYGLTDTLMCR